MPQTCATLGQRQQALELLLRKEEVVAWHLLLDLLPSDREVAIPAVTPSWRERQAVPIVTSGEVASAIQHVTTKAVEAAGTLPMRLEALITEFEAIASPVRELLLANIRTCASAEEEEGRRRVWDALRALVHKHRSFPDAHWTLPNDVLVQLEDLLSLLAPASRIVRAEWLFNDYWPDLPGPRVDAAAIDTATGVARQAALQDILATAGHPGVVALARVSKYPGLVGRTLAELRLHEEREVLRDTLGSPEECLRLCGAGMVTRSYTLAGREWAIAVFTANKSSWGVEGQVAFLLALPPDGATWTMLATAPIEVAAAYWARVSPYGLRVDDAAVAVDQLLCNSRPGSALTVASYHGAVLSSTLLIRILDDFAMAIDGHSEPLVDVSYQLGRLLDLLVDRDETCESELARLEWMYLPLLDRPGGLRAPVLQRMALCDSSLFAHLIECVYPPHGQPRAEIVTDEVAQRAKNAYGLLSSLHSMPGVGNEGTVDTRALHSWVNGVREQCKASGREIVGDHYIGQVLAHAPMGDDGAWPHLAVRELLEATDMHEVERGLRLGVHNKRGTTSRAWDEGGVQERDLAQKYRGWAAITGIQWPRTTALLEQLARDYEREAAHEDERAVLDRIRWG